MANKETTVNKEKIIVRNGNILNPAPSRDAEIDYQYRHGIGAGYVTENTELKNPDSVDLCEAVK